jgi:hypothetical protein
MQELQKMQSRVSIDILSSEVQFDLLASSSCEAVTDNSALSQELEKLGTRLSYMEDQPSTDEEEIKWLKKNYALLEIKDYLLMQKLSDKCDTKPVFILYFYSNKENVCDDCGRQGMVLTRLREEYPGLRVYSFDYDLDLSAQKTLISMYGIEESGLPALIANGEAHFGFQDIALIEEILPGLADLKEQETLAEEGSVTSTDSELEDDTTE